MAAAQHSTVGEQVYIAADRLRSHPELVRQRVDGLEPIGADKFNDGARAIFRQHGWILSPFPVPFDLHRSNEQYRSFFSFI